MSLTSRQAAQRGQAGTQRAVDGAGNRTPAAAAMAGAHAGHAAGVGDDIQALHAGIRVEGVTDRGAAGDAGKFAVAQFGAGGRLADSIGWIGIDGGRVGVLASVATDMDGLHVTIEDDDAVAFGLCRQAEGCAGGAADQQQDGQTSIESPHGIDSFFGGLALVQRCEGERADVVPGLRRSFDSRGWVLWRNDCCATCFRTETGRREANWPSAVKWLWIQSLGGVFQWLDSQDDKPVKQLWIRG